ncbi:MAG TPA: putative glycoside hydrolase [bacterium]|nr:putative glycoside hydrolase [bacterium]
MSKIWTTIFFFFSLVVPFGLARAATLPESYPRLANYYLKYYGHVGSADLEGLKKWDLLILPNDYQWAFPDFFASYKQAKPKGLVLAYVYPSMAMSSNINRLWELAEEKDLWLRDASGNRIEMWPGLYAINITKAEWQTINVNFLSNELDWNKWDGLMFDTVDAGISRFNKNGIDIDDDNQAESVDEMDSAWRQGMANIFKKTRDKLGSQKIILINGNSLASYQPKINGRVFETFPAYWEGNGSWSASMEYYLDKLPKQNYSPQIYVINGNTCNNGDRNNYQKMRFGLASALLGDGFFSFDYGEESHEQLWWYDEYSVNLGRPTSKAYNLLAINNSKIQAGLWRRDFENGVIVVNSTNKRQIYSLKNEELEKLRGTQAPLVNNGQIVNYIALEPSDGLVFLKRKLQVVNQTFFNGGFVRVFNQRGQTVRNGFFAYETNLAAGDQTILANLDLQGGLEQVFNRNNQIIVTKQGKIINKWQPFGAKYNGRPSLALLSSKNKKPDLIIGAGQNMAPIVRQYNYQGKLLSPEWLAFDKNFRGGINISAGYLNDKEMALAVSAQSGMAPVIKLYSLSGKLLSPEWLAFDKNFRGGVATAIGDISGDGQAEIVAVASIGGGPQVRIFNRQGKLLGQFQAFKSNSKTGYQVMISDINNDGRGEILVQQRN